MLFCYKYEKYGIQSVSTLFGEYVIFKMFIGNFFNFGALFSVPGTQYSRFFTISALGPRPGAQTQRTIYLLKFEGQQHYWGPYSPKAMYTALGIFKKYPHHLISLNKCHPPAISTVFPINIILFFISIGSILIIRSLVFYTQPRNPMQKFNATTPILLQSQIDRLHKFWPLLDLRAELDLRWTNNIDIPLRCIAPVHRTVSGLLPSTQGLLFQPFIVYTPCGPGGSPKIIQAQIRYI